jgi:hypothetical protein
MVCPYQRQCIFYNVNECQTHNACGIFQEKEALHERISTERTELVTLEKHAGGWTEDEI